MFGNPWPDNNALEHMHKCVMENLTAENDHKLYGIYPVIDYYKIVDSMVRRVKHKEGEKSEHYAARFYLPDGYHPSKIPTRHYVNEIFKILKVPGVDLADW